MPYTHTHFAREVTTKSYKEVTKTPCICVAGMVGRATKSMRLEHSQYAQLEAKLYVIYMSL